MPAHILALPTGEGTIDALLFAAKGPQPHPSVILFTDIRGSRPVYRAIAETLAAQGLTVLLPNLYYRSAPAPVVEPDAAFDDPVRARLQGYRALLTPAALARDFGTLIGALIKAPQANASRIGVVGYCMSGGFALRLAAAFPDRVLAAAAFHGGNLAVADDPDSPHHLAPKIRARLHIGHADQDASAPPEQIARLDGTLAEAGIDFTTELYAGARHGFAIADSAAFDPAASARHLKRLTSLFEETLL